MDPGFGPLGRPGMTARCGVPDDEGEAAVRRSGYEELELKRIAAQRAVRAAEDRERELAHIRRDLTSISLSLALLKLRRAPSSENTTRISPVCRRANPGAGSGPAIMVAFVLTPA